MFQLLLLLLSFVFVVTKERDGMGKIDDRQIKLKRDSIIGVRKIIRV